MISEEKITNESFLNVAIFSTKNPESNALTPLRYTVAPNVSIGMTEIEIPDIEVKIQNLENEIYEILTTEPYTFQELLDEEQAVREKKEALQKELDEYRKYHSELDGILNQLLADGGTHFVWRMN